MTLLREFEKCTRQGFTIYDEDVVMIKKEKIEPIVQIRKDW